MTNVEKLEQLGFLGDIREQLGAKDEHDDSRDARINKMDNDDILRRWSAWNIGDGTWWTDMKNIWDRLEEMDKPKPKSECDASIVDTY